MPDSALHWIHFGLISILCLDNVEARVAEIRGRPSYGWFIFRRRPPSRGDLHVAQGKGRTRTEAQILAAMAIGKAGLSP